jgi:hypothetical protein
MSLAVALRNMGWLSKPIAAQIRSIKVCNEQSTVRLAPYFISTFSTFNVAHCSWQLMLWRGTASFQFYWRQLNEHPNKHN